MFLKKGDKKLFWKLLDKLKKQKEGSFKHHISASRWNEHFKSILMNEKYGLTLPPHPTPTHRVVAFWTIVFLWKNYKKLLTF